MNTVNYQNESVCKMRLEVLSASLVDDNTLSNDQKSSDEKIFEFLKNQPIEAVMRTVGSLHLKFSAGVTETEAVPIEENEETEAVEDQEQVVSQKRKSRAVSSSSKKSKTVNQTDKFLKDVFPVPTRKVIASLKSTVLESRETVISDLKRMIVFSDSRSIDSTQERQLRVIVGHSPESDIAIDEAVVKKALHWNRLVVDPLSEIENKKRANWLAYTIAKSVELQVEVRLAALLKDDGGRLMQKDRVRAQVYKEYLGAIFPQDSNKFQRLRRHGEYAKKLARDVGLFVLMMPNVLPPSKMYQLGSKYAAVKTYLCEHLKEHYGDITLNEDETLVLERPNEDIDLEDDFEEEDEDDDDMEEETDGEIEEETDGDYEE